MREVKTVLAITFGLAALCFLGASSHAGSGQTPAFVLFLVNSVLSIALWHRTKADKERIARRKELAAFDDVDLSDDQSYSANPSGGSGGPSFAGYVILLILATPLMILKDLLKMQR